jgi:histone deacetylase 6
VNIPWPCGGMGDADYMYAFDKIIMPIAREFAPDIVLVSAGFDAAMGDELGECCVTPSGFAEMTRQLNTLANGKMALALEGGYFFFRNNKILYSCATRLHHCMYESPRR